MIEKTIEILKHKKDRLVENVKKFNKKARKLGASEMVVEFGEERVHSFYANEAAEIMGILTRIPYQEVTVKYEIPKFAGWDLVCVFDYEQYEDDDGHRQLAIFTNTVPDKVLPYEYQDKNEVHCDHCGHNRFRKKTFLVQHENGEYKEVGSTCLKDFLGHNPNAFLYNAGIQDRIKEMADELGSFGSTEPTAWDLTGILTLTHAVIKRYGWTSRGDAYNDSSLVATADNVSYYLTTPPEKQRVEERIELEDEDREIAEKTVEYFKSLEKQDNDYIMNCLKLIKIERVPERRLGVACSMIAVYRRHVEKQLAAANELPSEWFGNIGSKLEDCEVVCTFKTHVDNGFGGSSTLYKFMDNDGNIFKTFYSGYKWEAEQGERVKLFGTVKKHDEWNKKKETMLTRCKVKEL